MSTQGAAQIDIVINGISITAKKKNAVSLKVKRVMGESANEFVLEAFDETAYQIENALAGKGLASISVRYSSAKDLTKSYVFTGMCLDYQISFVGLATMISINGILSLSSGDSTSYWFAAQAIEWCGSEPENRGTYDAPDWWIDGKNEAEFSNYEDNEDVCAILSYRTNEDGVKDTWPTAYFNPSRIFKRIIHKYNGDNLGSTTISSSTTSTMTKTDNTTATWNFFRNKGFSEAATAGIMGNIQQESSFNPSILQNGKGPGAGLFQWGDYIKKTGRFKNLSNYAAKKGTNWTDLITQLEFALSEMPGCFNTYSKNNWGTKVTLDEFKTWTSIDNCTEIFEKVFERAGIPKMEKRKKYARSFFATYAGSKTTVSAPVSGWGTGGTGNFKLGQVENSRWVSDLDTKQQSTETAAQYINRVLCKNAVTATTKDYSSETAGFRYVIKNGEHCFISLGYNDKSTTTSKITLNYGMKNSTVISFSIANIGAMAMAGFDEDSDGNYAAAASALDAFTGDAITAAGENILGAEVSDEIKDETKAYKNWYLDKLKSVQVVSSASTSNLSANVSNAFTNLKNFTTSAELVVWADYSDAHSPGDFIDIVVKGSTGISHYSSGKYMIISIDDNVSSDGYTQSMKLLKYIGNEKSSKSTSSAEKYENPKIDLVSSITQISATSGLPVWIEQSQQETKKFLEKVEESGRKVPTNAFWENDPIDISKLQRR